jgi:hypothetical protein
MLARAVTVSACAVAIFTAFAHAATPGGGGQKSITDLAGRWAGSGTVQWKNGNQQPYKCTVTYFLGDNATRVKQTLRCQSPDENKLEIATLMQVTGETITGTWEETLSSMKGTVKGRVTATGYEAFAQNQFFNAAFEIEMANACEQQVTIRPSRDIAVIKANLRKC